MKKIRAFFILLTVAVFNAFPSDITVEDLPFELNMLEGISRKIVFDHPASSIREAKKRESQLDEFRSANLFYYRIERFNKEELNTAKNQEAFQNGFREAVRSKEELNQIVCRLLSETGTYKIFKTDYGAKESWYEKLRVGSCYYGETYFYASREQSLAPNFFQYAIVFSTDNLLYRITLSFNDPSWIVTGKATAFFYKKGANWYVIDSDFDMHQSLRNGDLSEIDEYAEYLSLWTQVTEAVESYIKTNVALPNNLSEAINPEDSSSEYFNENCLQM